MILECAQDHPDDADDGRESGVSSHSHSGGEASWGPVTGRRTHARGADRAERTRLSSSSSTDVRVCEGGCAEREQSRDAGAGAADRRRRAAAAESSSSTGGSSPSSSSHGERRQARNTPPPPQPAHNQKLTTTRPTSHPDITHPDPAPTTQNHQHTNPTTQRRFSQKPPSKTLTSIHPNLSLTPECGSLTTPTQTTTCHPRHPVWWWRIPKIPSFEFEIGEQQELLEMS